MKLSYPNRSPTRRRDVEQLVHGDAGGEGDAQQHHVGGEVIVRLEQPHACRRGTDLRGELGVREAGTVTDSANRVTPTRGHQGSHG
ncbi:MAG: hypothetical protein RLZZ362_2 [Actinomycetota bacterium]